jgi:hypothetical protein
VERDCHDSIGVIKGLFDTVAVMNIDIEVKDSGVYFEQLKNAENDIIDVTEPTGLGLFAMMEATGPVDNNTSLLSENEIGCIDTTASGQLAEIIQALEARVIKVLINLKNRMQSRILPCLGIVFDKAILFYGLAGQRVDPSLKVPYIVRMVEGLKLLGGGLLEVKNIQFLVQTV